MIKRLLQPELPSSARSTEPPFRRMSSARRFLHQIEFFSGGGHDALFVDEAPPLIAASWSMVNHEAQPRDPRLRQAIKAAARGWVVARKPV